MLQINQDEFKALILDGATVKDLQEKYGISRSTVYVYKKKWNLLGLGPHAKVRAEDLGYKICSICNSQKGLEHFHSNGFAKDGKKKYKPSCKPCNNAQVSEDHYKLIQEVLNELDRKLACEMCGYKKNYAALCFHHFDPSEKEEEISKMKTASKFRLKQEIEKCALLCANCHAEEHNSHLEILADR